VSYMLAYRFDFGSVLDFMPTLVSGCVVTLQLTAIGGTGGLLLGILGAWARTATPCWVRKALSWYVEIVRNTPFLIQLSFIYFGLPSFGIRLSGFEASIIAIVFNMAAYNIEIVRAGIVATPHGQLEAARSMAMKQWQIFWYVVLRPALKRVWPALSTQIVLLVLDSAVCSQVSTKELTYAANVISSHNFRSFETYLVATAVYFVLAVGVRRFLASLEKRFISRRRTFA